MFLTTEAYAGPRTKETPDYDPRYDRAQTVEGAKARYVSDDLPDYQIADLERDLGRLLSDAAGNETGVCERPLLGGQRIVK